MKTMEYGYIVINLIILFAFFVGHTKWTMDLFNRQAAITDQILAHLNLNQRDEEE